MPLLAALAVCVCAAGAAGGTLEFHETISRTEKPGEPNEVDVPLIFPKFNPAQGILKTVTISTELKFEGVKQLENLDPNFSTGYRLTLRWDFDVLRPDRSLMLPTTAMEASVGLVDPFDGIIDFDGFSGVTLRPATDAFGEAVFDSVADLALFTGTGDIELIGAGSHLGTALVFDVGLEDIMTDFTGFVDGRVNLVYDYMIPEPTTFALFMLTSATLIRRRARWRGPRLACHSNHQSL